MNIVILGSGGREHALCKKIYLSKKAKKIYSIPGNAGTSDISENINLPLNDFSKIEKFIKNLQTQQHQHYSYPKFKVCSN